METALKASNKSVKSVSTLQYIFDIKSWIAPYLDEIHGHTAPHVFRFRFNHTSKKGEMHYKYWSHQAWETDGMDSFFWNSLFTLANLNSKGYSFRNT